MQHRSPEKKAEYARLKRERRAAARAARGEQAKVLAAERLRERQATEDAARLALLEKVVAEGGNIADMARTLGLRPSTLESWAGRAGVRTTDLWRSLDKTGMHGPQPQPGDDDYIPTAQERRQERLDDIEWMVSFGVSDVEVARRTDMTLTTLERYLYRNGRGDLWAEMSRYRAPNAWRGEDGEQLLSFAPRRDNTNGRHA